MFLAGFLTKLGKKTKEHGDSAGKKSGALLPGFAAGLVGHTLFQGTSRGGSPDSNTAFIQAANKHHGHTPSVKYLSKNQPFTHSGAQYLRAVGNVTDQGTIKLHPNNNLAVAAHEWGHARNSAKRYFKNSSKSDWLRLLSRSNASKGGALLAGAAMSQSDSEKARKWAPVVAAVGHVPTVMEEVLASARGLKELHRQKGLKSALKGTVPMAGGMATYLAAPLLSYGITKAITKQKKEKS